MSILLIDKSNTAGFSANVGELLKALKNKVFNNSPDEAPIMVHQSTGDGEEAQPVTCVFKCGSCDKLHIESGWYDTANLVLTKDAVIYQDYRDREDKYIQRSELIKILGRIDAHDKIYICTTQDLSLAPLTIVMKCSDECPSVHLLSGYSVNSISAN